MCVCLCDCEVCRRNSINECVCRAVFLALNRRGRTEVFCVLTLEDFLRGLSFIYMYASGRHFHLRLTAQCILGLRTCFVLDKNDLAHTTNFLSGSHFDANLSVSKCARARHLTGVFGVE